MLIQQILGLVIEIIKKNTLQYFTIIRICLWFWIISNCMNIYGVMIHVQSSAPAWSVHVAFIVNLSWFCGEMPVWPLSVRFPGSRPVSSHFWANHSLASKDPAPRDQATPAGISGRINSNRVFSPVTTSSGDTQLQPHSAMASGKTDLARAGTMQMTAKVGNGHRRTDCLTRAWKPWTTPWPLSKHVRRTLVQGQNKPIRPFKAHSFGIDVCALSWQQSISPMLLLWM